MTSRPSPASRSRTRSRSSPRSWRCRYWCATRGECWRRRRGTARAGRRRRPPAAGRRGGAVYCPPRSIPHHVVEQAAVEALAHLSVRIAEPVENLPGAGLLPQDRQVAGLEQQRLRGNGVHIESREELIAGEHAVEINRQRDRRRGEAAAQRPLGVTAPSSARHVSCDQHRSPTPLTNTAPQVAASRKFPQPRPSPKSKEGRRTSRQPSTRTFSAGPSFPTRRSWRRSDGCDLLTGC